MAKENAHRAYGSPKMGRPRSLTLDDILATAERIGLTNIRMPALAAELGIATATLYNYVAGRAELLRLAAERQAKPAQTYADSQDWRDVVRAHARETFEYWARDPQLLDQFMRGAIGPDIMIDYLEDFLTALVRRGFNAQDSYHALSVVNTMAFGAVVRAYYLRSVQSQEGGHKATIRQTLRRREPDELPILRASIDFIEDPDFDFQASLETVIEGLAAKLERTPGGPTSDDTAASEA